MNLRHSIFLIAVTTMLCVSCGGEAQKPPNEAATTASEGPGVLPGKASDPSASVPLPRRDVPLIQVIHELEKRADGGDAQAACALVAEYENCENIQQDLLRAQRVVETSAQQDSNSFEARDSARGYVEAILEKSKYCEGIKIPPAGKRIGYLRGAALQGHLPSLTAYATGRAFKPSSVLDNLDALRTYKAEALDLAWLAAKNGSLEARLSLARAYAPREQEEFISGDLLSQVVTPDPVRALALHYVVQADAQEKIKDPNVLTRLERRMALLTAELDASQLAQAKQEAAKFKAEWGPVATPAIERPTVGGLTPSGFSTSAQCESGTFVSTKGK